MFVGIFVGMFVGTEYLQRYTLIELMHTFIGLMHTLIHPLLMYPLLSSKSKSNLNLI